MARKLTAGRWAALLLAVLCVLASPAPAGAQSVPDDSGYDLTDCSSAGYDGYEEGCGVASPKPRLLAAPATPRVGGDVQMTAAASGHAPTYAWDLDDDGAYDDGTTRNVTTRFADAGAHRVAVRVTDDVGRVALVERTIDAHTNNHAPGGILSVTPYSPHTGAPVTFASHPYDTDGTVTAVAFDLDGDGSFETAADAAGEATTTFTTEGRRTVRARFTDDSGATATVTRQVDVGKGNLVPFASVSMYPTTARPGQEVEVYGSATDVDGRIVRYQFDLDGDGSYETDADNQWVYTTFPAAGTYEIGIKVTDNDGATGVGRRSIQVSADSSPPSITSLTTSASAGRLYANVYAQDNDGTIRQVAWDLDGDQVYEDRVDELEYPSSYISSSTSLPLPGPGTVEIGVRITDSSGSVTTSRKAVRIDGTPPRPPIVYQSTTARAGQTTTFSASYVADQEYEWDLDNDGAFDDSEGSYVATVYPAAGSYEVRVRATNGFGSAVGRGVITVSPASGNLSPTLNISPQNSPRAGVTASFFASATDADGTIAAYAWDFDNDGDFDDGTTSFASYVFAAAGTYTVAVKATDNAGASTIQRAVVAVHEGNTAPLISVTTSDGSTTATVGRPVTVRAQEDGGTGDDRIVKWEWDTDEDGIFDDFLDTSSTYSSSTSITFGTAGVHRVKVRVTDQGGATSVGTLLMAVVGAGGTNHAPRVSISLRDVVKTGVAVFPSATASDPDGDALTYAWDLDEDGAFDDGTSSFPGVTFTSTGVHLIRVRVSDPAGAFAVATTSVNAVSTNLPPVIQDFRISGETRVGQPTYVSYWAYDREDGYASATFDLDGDGAFDDSLVNGYWTPTSTAPQTLAMKAVDQDGASAVATFDVRPTADALPPTGWIRSSTDQLVAGRTASFSAQVTDYDTNGWTFAWDLDGDGQFDDHNGRTATVTLVAPTLKLGVRITDEAGASTIVRGTYEVGSRPPTAEFSVSNLEPDEGETVALTSTSSDPDDGIVAQRWDLDNDGQFDDATGIAVQLPVPTAGNVRVGLQVRDAARAVGVAYRVIRVQSKTAPKASFTVSPERPLQGQTVTLRSTSTDRQNDIVAQDWDLDDDRVFDDASGATATTAFRFSGTNRVRLRVRDQAGHEAIARLDVRVRYDDGGGTPTGPPDNDAFAAAKPLTVAAPEGLGQTSLATAEAGEPAHAGHAASHSVWFRYDATATRSVTFGTCGSHFDTVLAVYRGSALGALEPVASDDDSGCDDGTSKVTFDAVAGTIYWLALDGFDGDAGSFRIVLYPQPVLAVPSNDDRAQAILLPGATELIATNVRATKEAGEADHAGNAGGHSIWYLLRPTTSGRMSLDACTATFSTLLAIYTDTGAPVAASGSPCAPVAFNTTAGASYYIAVDGRDGAEGTFTLKVRNQPANDAFAAAAALNGSAAGTTTLGTAEAGEPAHAGSAAAHSVWYTLTTNTTATQILSTCTGSTAPTRIAVYEGASLAALTPIAAAGPLSGCAGGNGARVAWHPSSSATRTYRIAVDIAGLTDADFKLDTGTAPINDDRAYALPLNSYSTGTTISATHEAGEPEHGGGASVWYVWQPYDSGRARVASCLGETTDTIIAVYKGEDLTPVGVNDDTAGCGNGKQSLVEFDYSANERYYVAVDSRLGQTGPFTLRMRTRPGNDNRADAPTVSGDTVGGWLDLATKEAGEPDHAGKAGGHSIWYRWTPRVSGSFAIDTCGTSAGGNLDTLLAVYAGSSTTATAANDDTPGCGSGGTGSRVTVDATAGTTYFVAVDSKAGDLGDVTLAFPPLNDFFAAADTSQGETFYGSGYLTRATAQPGEPAHAGSAAQRSVWYAWTPPRSAQATVDTCGYTSTRLGAYTGADLAALVAIAPLPRSTCGSGQSGQRIRFAATAGVTYRFAVDATAANASYFSVYGRLAQANDQQADATSLGSWTNDFIDGTSDSASLEAGEPDHAGGGGQASVWYSWTAPRSGTVRMDTCTNTGFDTVLALYNGSTPVASNDDTPGCSSNGRGSRIRVHVDQGTTYNVAVSGHGDVEGYFRLSYAMGAANDDFAAAQTLSTGTLSGTTIDAGRQASEPDHGALGGDHSVWYRFTLADTRNLELRACPTDGGATPALSVYTGTSLPTLLASGTATTRVIGGITCRVISLRGATGQRYVAVDGGAPLAQGTFSLTLALAPANDDIEFAAPLAGSGGVSGTTSAASAEAGEPVHAGVSGGRSVWYHWTPARSGPVSLDTCGSGLDSLLAVYTRSGSALTPVTADDDGCGTTASRVTFAATAGQDYYVAVDGKNGAEGEFVLWLPPANDLFAAAQTLSGTAPTANGTTAHALPEPGEPAHAGSPAARSAWYTWAPPRSGAAELSTCLASPSDTRVALYTGTTPAALIPVASSGPVAGCASGHGARIRTRVTGGITYRIAVDGAGDSFTLQAALAPTNDDRADAITVGDQQVVTGTTAFATAETGEPTRGGEPAAASVWYRVHATTTQKLSLKTCASGFATVLGVYDTGMNEVAAAVGGTGPCANRAAVKIDAVAGTDYLVALDGKAGATGPFSLSIGAADNDDIADATVLTGARASGFARTDVATTQDGEPTDVNSGSRSVWWRWTAPSSGTIEVNACGSDYQTQLSVYRTSVSVANRVGQNVFGTGCNSRSVVTFTATAGTTYYFGLSAYSGSGGNARLQLNPPANDRFAGAVALSGRETTAAGTLEGASAEDSEPTHNASGARRTIWYAWTATDTGLLTLDSCGSAAPVYIAAYLGTTLSGLVKAVEAPPTATCPAGSPGRVLTVGIEAGKPYRIALDGEAGAIGATALHLKVVLDSVPPETTLEDGPPALSSATSATFRFSANETGSTFECRLDGAAFAACASPYTTAVAEGARTFEVRAVDPAGNPDPTPAKLTFTIDRTPPPVTVDQAPPEYTNSRTATFAWSSTDTTAKFRCQLEGEAEGACTSPVVLSNLADRAYTFHIRATDPAGNLTDVKRTFTVETGQPETTIDGAPSSPTNVAALVFSFSSPTGTAFECSLDGAAFAACTSPLTLTGLADGTHTLQVRAKDRAGNVDATPASRTVVVDRREPQTTITSAPSAPVHDHLAFAFSADETATFECAIDAGSFAACVSGASIDLRQLVPGEHTFRVRAKDGAGNVDATPSSATFTYANATPVGTLSLTPDAGTVGTQVAATIGATDADDSDLDYALDWGDGSRTSGSLPSAPLKHTYSRSGVFVVRLSVGDGLSVHVVTRTVNVVLAEPLRAVAGDDLIAVAGEPVTIDGSATRPQAGVEGFSWAFGDGGSGYGATVTHTYAQAGTYTATLTAQAGSATDTDTATITVIRPEDAPGILVTVTSGGTPLRNADVLVTASSGERVAAVTDASGRARLRGLRDGAYTVLAYADHHLPGSVRTTQSGGSGTATLDLPTGEVAKAEITSKPLTLSEIRALGIDENDPANQNATSFTIKLRTTSLDGVATSGGFWPRSGGGLTCTRLRCSGSTSDGRVQVDHTDLGDGVDGLTTLVIPGKAKWLKEFFAVSMTIHNLAPDPQFVLRHGVATLELPSGLSLAPTARGEHLQVNVADIAGGQDAGADWIVRGDTEGSYTLGGGYAATLEPFGHSVSVRATMDEPLKVWGMSAIKLTVDADETAYEGNPYHVTVGLKNVADVPVYNVSLELLKAQAKNFIFQPRERLSHFTGTLDPGDTLDHDFILVPTFSGQLDLAQSAVSFGAGEPKLATEITEHPVVNPPESAPSVRVFPMKDKLGLRWDPVPGATGYAVYSTSAPDVQFGSSPDPAATVLTDDNGKPRAVVRNLAEDEKRYYAISPIVGGKPRMSHKLISAKPDDGVVLPDISAEYDWPSRDAHMCAVDGHAKGTLRLSFIDDFFDVKSYKVTLNGRAMAEESPGTGHEHGEDLVLDLLDGQTATIVVTAVNSDNDQATRTYKLDTKCNRESAVVVAMGLFSDVKADWSSQPVTRPTCGDDPRGNPETVGDAFFDQAGVNACDAVGDANGNLIAWLMNQGYNLGQSRKAGNRTLLEFSYNGATVGSCTSKDSVPRFTPNDYTWIDTVRELVDQVPAERNGTANNYLNALIKYDECWRRVHGRSLRYTVIGHSLGGYEALRLAYSAVNRGVANLFDGIVTVDGAVHPLMVPLELDVHCFTDFELIQLPLDLLNNLRSLDPRYQVALWETHKAQALHIGSQIRAMQAAGMQVATVTNHYDDCLRETATINDSADDRAIWKIAMKGWSGRQAHGAALHSHRSVTEDVGFPLVEFLKSQLYVQRQGVYYPDPDDSLVKSKAKRVAARAEEPALRGNVRWVGSNEPLTAGQVTAVGADGMQYAGVQPDGSFAFDTLAAGTYTLRATSVAGTAAGAWAGGATRTQFTVGADPVDAGTILVPRPVTTTVTVVDTNGAPLAGAVAMLFDDEDRPVAYGETDAQGVSALAASPGHYRLAAAASRSATSIQPLEVAAASAVRVVLNAGLQLTATAKDADGTPLAGVLVGLYGPDGSVKGAGVTNAEGAFSFLDVAAGDYAMRLFEPFGRQALPNVSLPVSAVPGDPAAGAATFQFGVSPVLTSGAPKATAALGEPYAFAFTASGANAVFSVGGGSLPPGLALGQDGKLAGRPTKAGVYAFSVRVVNAAGTIVEGPFMITVGAAEPAFTSGAAPDGTVGEAYAFRFTASGAPAPEFTLASGALPVGLVLERDGSLHGTPSAAGTFSFAVTATNDAGSVSAPVTVRVVAADGSPVTPQATPVPTQTPGPGPAADTVAPKVTVLKAETTGKAFSAVAGKGTLATSFTVSERAAIIEDLLLASATAKKLKVSGRAVTVGGKKYVAVGKATATGTGSLKLTVKIGRAIAKKLGKQKKLAFVLRVTATDGAGNTGTATVAVTLKKK